MANLTFKYGVMGSSKSLQLLVQRHNLEQLGKVVYATKPELDTRSPSITSRVGLEHTPRFSFTDLTQPAMMGYVDYILVDEAQFLTNVRVSLLRTLADLGTEVYCYGLKTDFKGELFEGSKRLLELADVIEEIPVICKHCTNKAIFNMRIDKDGKKVIEGDVVQIGGDESYAGVCSQRYFSGRCK